MLINQVEFDRATRPVEQMAFARKRHVRTRISNVNKWKSVSLLEITEQPHLPVSAEY